MTEPFVFSRRTDWPLTANKLTSALEYLRAENTPILDLTESNPTRCGFSYPGDSIVRSLARDENLTYTPTPQGNSKTREAISAYYKERGFNVPYDRIFLTASTSEAYSYLFRLLANPSDQVLFPRPSYPLFSFLGDLNDCIMDTYPLRYDGKWRIDLNAVNTVLRQDTKALVLVSPNNPTGSLIQKNELEELNTLCRQQNTALICDEVFSDFIFDQNKDYISLVHNAQVLTFVLGGISKTLGLPQMKLSWIIINGPRDLVKRASSRLEVIADTYLSVNTPIQNALSVWLSHRKEIQSEINERIKKNYSTLKKLSENTDACELFTIEGGWYAVLKIPETYSEEEWALSFLNKDHVFVHPGYFFDFDTEGFVVISLLPPRQIFQEGIKHIIERVTSGIL